MEFWVLELVLFEFGFINGEFSECVLFFFVGDFWIFLRRRRFDRGFEIGKKGNLSVVVIWVISYFRIL